MWFDSWTDILRVLMVGAVSYATLVGVLRQEDELRRNRWTESEVLQAVRGSGSGDLSSAAAVVLGTNGNLSVIPSSKLGNGSALKRVAGPAKQAG